MAVGSFRHLSRISCLSLCKESASYVLEYVPLSLKLCVLTGMAVNYIGSGVVQLMWTLEELPVMTTPWPCSTSWSDYSAYLAIPPLIMRLSCDMLIMYGCKSCPYLGCVLK